MTAAVTYEVVVAGEAVVWGSGAGAGAAGELARAVPFRALVGFAPVKALQGIADTVYSTPLGAL